VNLAADLVAVATAIACAGLVVVRAATAPAPPPLRTPSVEERATFAQAIAAQEDEWRAKSAVAFPGDHWSQRDAFHNYEATAVRELARGAGVSYGEVLRSIDRDIHRKTGADRSADVVPCMPRPFYD
jgi:hypothetical protein